MKQTLLCFCHGFYCLKARELERKQEGSKEGRKEVKKEGRTDEWMDRLAMVLTTAEATFPVLCSLRLLSPSWLWLCLQHIKNGEEMKKKLKKNDWGDELFGKFTYRLMQGLIQPCLLTGGATVIYTCPTGYRGCCSCLENFQWNVWESESLCSSKSIARKFVTY